MIKSMTGYGRGEYAGETGSYLVEISSTNHRFLEVKARLPRGWLLYEPRIEKEIARRFRRGHFELYLTERSSLRAQGPLTTDWGLAAQYVEALRLLKKRLRLPGRVDIRLLASMREVFSSEESRATEERWGDAEKSLAQALNGLEEMRRKEGSALEAQIRGGLAEIQRLLESIRTRWLEAKKEHQERIRERVTEMMGGTKVENNRMEQELALWAERWDIAEECMRLQSHLDQAQDLLAQESPAGRSLDFLLQEMNREANTISAKASDALICHRVIEVKTELERLREQVQNVE
ncbi:MAG: YicC family protein [candidate division NC10 bacterium]|nr:YicC family protein [candidate division NC10 bacterium]